MSKFTFRVQAAGGKFLASDIGGALVVVHDAETGAVLAQGPTRGDSGTLVAAPNKDQVRDSSKSQVALADGSASWWLVADDKSSAFTPDLDVADLPRKVRVVVSGPTGGLQSASRVSTNLWLQPGGNPGLPGYVILLPGLLVEPVDPLLHTAVSPDDTVHFVAKVTMMCGCQIAETGNWPSGDFTLTTTIQRLEKGGDVRVDTLPMVFATNPKYPASSFATLRPFKVPATGQDTVYYSATITAVQKGTGNTGTATIDFYCQ